MTIGLVAAGGGIGVVPHWLARDEIAAGTLVAHEPQDPMRGPNLGLASARSVPGEIVGFLLSAGHRALRAQELTG